MAIEACEVFDLRHFKRNDLQIINLGVLEPGEAREIFFCLDDISPWNVVCKGKDTLSYSDFWGVRGLRPQRGTNKVSLYRPPGISSLLGGLAVIGPDGNLLGRFNPSTYNSNAYYFNGNGYLTVGDSYVSLTWGGVMTKTINLPVDPLECEIVLALPSSGIDKVYVENDYGRIEFDPSDPTKGKIEGCIIDPLAPFRRIFKPGIYNWPVDSFEIPFMGSLMAFEARILSGDLWGGLDVIDCIGGDVKSTWLGSTSEFPIRVVYDGLNVKIIKNVGSGLTWGPFTPRNLLTLRCHYWSMEVLPTHVEVASPNSIIVRNLSSEPIEDMKVLNPFELPYFV